MKTGRNAIIVIVALLLLAYVAFSAITYFQEDSGTGNEASPAAAERERVAEFEGVYSTLMAHLGAGEYDAMIATANEALTKHPGVAMLHYMRGFAYLQKNLLDQAIQDFSSALDIQPTHADAYRFRSQAYKTKGDLDRAVADADKACELEPANAESYIVRAMAYLTKGDRERAKSDVAKVLELDPDNPKAKILLQQLQTADGRAAQ